MIDEQTTATTTEICLLAGFTKQRLGKLESQGIVTRLGRDQWPLATTMRALLSDARERSEAHSAARAELDKLRTAREQLKLKKECSEVVYLHEFQTAIDAVAFSVLQRLAPLASRIGKQDLALRRLVEGEVRAAQALMSSDMKAQADALENTGKAL
jgi:phage terminase Nu1 subunit (DNA packaging protein)